MPVSVAIDQAQRLYVADNTDRIQTFTTKGEYQGGWRTRPTMAIRRWAAWPSMGKDNIYVSSIFNIYVYRPR